MGKATARQRTRAITEWEACHCKSITLSKSFWYPEIRKKRNTLDGLFLFVNGERKDFFALAGGDNHIFGKLFGAEMNVRDGQISFKETNELLQFHRLQIYNLNNGEIGAQHQVAVIGREISAGNIALDPKVALEQF